jgi:nucleotide-binding universal stress UspA family protein
VAGETTSKLAAATAASAAFADAGEMRALVVGHDEQRSSAAALLTAVHLARRLGAQLDVVHSVYLEDSGIDPDTEAYEQETQRRVRAERASITATLSEVPVHWTYHECRGDPALGLIKVADSVRASLIVVGATRPGVLHRLFNSESVPQRLLRLQHRPVVIVPSESLR